MGGHVQGKGEGAKSNVQSIRFQRRLRVWNLCSTGTERNLPPCKEFKHHCYVANAPQISQIISLIYNNEEIELQTVFEEIKRGQRRKKKTKTKNLYLWTKDYAAGPAHLRRTTPTVHIPFPVLRTLLAPSVSSGPTSLSSSSLLSSSLLRFGLIVSSAFRTSARIQRFFSSLCIRLYLFLSTSGSLFLVIILLFPCSVSKYLYFIKNRFWRTTQCCFFCQNISSGRNLVSSFMHSFFHVLSSAKNDLLLSDLSKFPLFSYPWLCVADKF